MDSALTPPSKWLPVRSTFPPTFAPMKLTSLANMDPINERSMEERSPCASSGPSINDELREIKKSVSLKGVGKTDFWVGLGSDWDRLYREGMRDTDLFQLALGLKSPWMVTCSEFAVGNGQLDLYVDFPRGSRFACAECGGEGCAVHDTKDETWRHLDFFQHRTLLHAR